MSLQLHPPPLITRLDCIDLKTTTPRFSGFRLDLANREQTRSLGEGESERSGEVYPRPHTEELVYRSPDHSLFSKSGILGSRWQPADPISEREGALFLLFVNRPFITFIPNYPIFTMPSVSCWAPD